LVGGNRISGINTAVLTADAQYLEFEITVKTNSGSFSIHSFRLTRTSQSVFTLSVPAFKSGSLEIPGNNAAGQHGLTRTNVQFSTQATWMTDLSFSTGSWNFNGVSRGWPSLLDGRGGVLGGQ